MSLCAHSTPVHCTNNMYTFVYVCTHCTISYREFAPVQCCTNTVCLSIYTRRRRHSHMRTWLEHIICRRHLLTKCWHLTSSSNAMHTCAHTDWWYRIARKIPTTSRRTHARTHQRSQCLVCTAVCTVHTHIHTHVSTTSESTTCCFVTPTGCLLACNYTAPCILRFPFLGLYGAAPICSVRLVSVNRDGVHTRACWMNCRASCAVYCVAKRNN